MKKLLTVAAVGVVAMFLLGGTCEGPPSLEPPDISKVVMGESDVTVYWNPSVDEENEDFTGYNVYVFTDSTLYDLAGDNDTLADYLVNDSPITDTTYTITGLKQDTIYYIQVRTVSGEDNVGDYNLSQPYVKASPRPERTVTLELEVSPSSQCAIDFASGEIGTRGDLSTTWGDMWVDYDSQLDSVWFDSPMHGNTNCRTTLLENKGQMEFDDLWEVTQDPTEESVGIDEGDLIVAKTEDGNYVKIYVEVLDKTGSPPTVKITYAYQNVTGFPGF